jgi:hypothetical protein
VLFFLPDPAAALSAWRDLVVPGGRIGVSTFGRQDPRWVALDQVFTPFLPAQLLDARTSGVSGPFGSDEGVESLFREAGLSDVRTVPFEQSVVLRDADHWLEWTWSHGQRVMWEAIAKEEDRLAVEDAARALLKDIRDEDGVIRLTQDVRYTIGRRASELGG